MEKAVHTIRANFVLHIETRETNASIIEGILQKAIMCAFDADEDKFELFTDICSVTTTFQE